MADRPSHFNPKIDRLHDPKEGQGFQHELSPGRKWEHTLDLIHYSLLNKWYYIATASNTNGGMFTPVRTKISLKRRKKKIPEELQSLLKLKMRSFNSLDKKITLTKKLEGNKDIWHFKGQWEEFPHGTSVIEIHQKTKLSQFSEDPTYRKAFVILDGQAELEQQNHAMLLVDKILSNHAYVKELTAKMAKSPAKEVSKQIVKKKDQIYEGRPAGEMILRLKENFTIFVRTIKEDEKAALDIYFGKLHKQGEMNSSLEKIKEELNDYFAKDFADRH